MHTTRTDTDEQADQLPALRLALRARPENVAVVRQVLGGIAAALGMDERAVDDLRLALSEACTNVVVHAYDNPGEETFEVEAWADGALLHVSVSDRGPARQGGMSTPGLGMGLPIIRELAEEVEIGDLLDRDPPEHQVRMTFVLPEPA